MLFRSGLLWDGVGDGLGFASAHFAFHGIKPAKEGHGGARDASVISVVEVIGAGVVKIYGCFHQALSEHLLVKVDIGLGLFGDGCDVM